MKSIYINLVVTALCLICLLGNGSCKTSLKYQDDIGFLNSAQANSYEYPLKVGGSLCKDMDGRVGACVKQTASDNDLGFRIDSQPYSYRLVVNCSSSVDSDFSVDVEKGKSYSWKISPEKFFDVRSFTCIGEIFPDDRVNSLSAKWHVRVLIFDGEYSARERIYHREGHLVLGKFAKYSMVCTGSKCKRYEKKTVVKAPNTAKAYSESEVLRMNYYGF